MTSSGKSRNRRFITVCAVIAALIAVVAIVVNVLAFVVFDTYFTDVFGSTPPSNSGANGRLDLEYHKSSYRLDSSLDEAIGDFRKVTAEESIVLLENENCLPLPRSNAISIYGAGSRLLGDDLTLAGALVGAGYTVTPSWDYYVSGGGAGYSGGFREAPIYGTEMYGGVGLFVIRRVSAPELGGARDIDLPRGMYDRAEAEDADKHYLELSEGEKSALRALNGNYEKIIVVESSPCAFELDALEEFDSVKATLFLPDEGDDFLTALANIICGKVTPSGRLTDTWAADAFSSPAMENFGDFAFVGAPVDYYYTEQREGIYVGYRYYETRYEDFVTGRANVGDFDYSSEVVYPFGYGLSYATFSCDGFELTAPDSGGNMTASAVVRNTSLYFGGKDTVQFYLSAPFTAVDVSRGTEKALALIAYVKTGYLAPGGEETVTVTFNLRDFASYSSVNEAYVLTEGRYYIAVAGNAHEAANNILAAKYRDGIGVDPARMCGSGNAARADFYYCAETAIASDETGGKIRNRFSAESEPSEKLSRGDWAGTYPTPAGTRSGTVSDFDERVTDGVGYRYERNIDERTLSGLSDQSSGSETYYDEMPVYGAKSDVELIDLRGKGYDDAAWSVLLENMLPGTLSSLVARAGRNTATVTEINKPRSSERETQTFFSAPRTVAVAHTWNDGIASEFGRLIGECGLVRGINGWYMPTGHIHRTPFGGWNADSLSEDPLISGRMLSEAAKSCASLGVYPVAGALCPGGQCAHSAGDNGLLVYATEQALRELYLRPAEITLKSGNRTVGYYERNAGEFESYYALTAELPYVTAVRSSSMRIGARWSGGYYGLMTGLLRDEWGFCGMVLTDSSEQYMNITQMLCAGGDAKMSQLDIYAEPSYNPTAAHEALRAAKNIFFCTVNSSLMNGFIHGVRYVPGTPYYVFVVIAIDVALGIALLVIGWILLRRYGPERFRKKPKPTVTTEILS